MADTSRMKPDFAVTLDGNKLQGEEAAAIIGIRVFQTRFGASAFELIVSDPDLKWQGKPTFTECKEVKIELGIPGSDPVVLGPGDMVVVGGVEHRWQPLGEQPARMAAVMIYVPA